MNKINKYIKLIILQKNLLYNIIYGINKTLYILYTFIKLTYILFNNNKYVKLYFVIVILIEYMCHC